MNRSRARRPLAARCAEGAHDENPTRADLGIQNEQFSDDPGEAAWALESWGVAMADMMWPMPLTVVALAGVLRRRFIGLAAGLMACAIGVYFPLFFAFQRWQTFPGAVIIALVMFLVPCLVATVGLWSNRSWFESPHAANTSSRHC